MRRYVGSGQVLIVFAMTAMLSGCLAADSSTKTASPSATEAAKPAEFGDATGAVAGLIVDEENQPVPAATAGLRELNQQATSDATGAFTFSNVAPGDYTMDIVALGYQSQAKKISVAAGNVAHVNVILARVAAEGPYYTTVVQQGNIQCSVRAYPGVPTTGAGGLPKWTTGAALCSIAPLPGFAPDHFLLVFNASKGVKEMLLEMTWTSTQAAGSALSVTMENNGVSNDPKNTYGTVSGKSPLKIYADQTVMANITTLGGKDCFADGCKLQTRVFAEAQTTGTVLPLPTIPDPVGNPPGNRLDLGLTLDQKFVQYFTQFHGEPRPEGFSALSDA